MTLTYLGVAGWQLEGAGHVVLVDPYFSRPPANSPDPLVPDAAAIAQHVPAHADAVVVGHSHYDHLLDAPSVARATGATLIGSLGTIRVGRATGLADEQLLGVTGGEDLQLAPGLAIRAIPSLHSMLGADFALGEIADGPTLPMREAGYRASGTFAYLVRLGTRTIVVFDTANFVEGALVGVRADIAIVAPGLREKVRDYTCRLVHALGDPPIVLATHFDDWHGPPVDHPPSDDLVAFVREVERCAPGTRVVIPKHFDRMAL